MESNILPLFWRLERLTPQNKIVGISSANTDTWTADPAITPGTLESALSPSALKIIVEESRDRVVVIVDSGAGLGVASTWRHAVSVWVSYSHYDINKTMGYTMKSIRRTKTFSYSESNF